jgi:CubicO group peptidase (beta-lactamase class C family)
MGYPILTCGKGTAWVLVLVFGLCITGCSKHEKDEEKPPPHSVAELEQRIRAILEETHTPGVGAALVTKDEVPWVAGIGKADVAADKDVTTDTLFRVGSISKSFASLAVLKLQEEGKLHLEDRIRERAPEVAFTNRWEDTEPVRLAHVLEHTAGIDDIALCEYAASDPTIGLRDALAFHPSSRTARWRPGTHFSYSNSGPVVAAYVVEKAAGMRFEDYIQEQFFDPLEMKTASYFLTETVKRNLAKSYGRDRSREIPYWHIIDRPSGSISATPREMAYLVQMFLNRGKYKGGTLLKPVSIERMETPVTTLAGQQGIRAGYALGNFTSSYKGFLFHGHSGGIEGFLSSYSYLPDHGVGYFFAINAGNGEAVKQIGDLLRAYLTHDLSKPETPTTFAVSADGLRTWAGYYEPITPRQEVAHFLERLAGIVYIKAEDGKLQARPLVGESEALIPVAEGQFRTKDDPIATVAFLRDDSGESILQSNAGSMRGNFRAIPAWLAWTEGLLTAFSLTLMLSSVLFALIWVPRKLFRRMKDVPGLSIRVIPLLGILCLAGAFVLLTLAGVDADALFARFGKMTIWSVAFCALTWLFALATVAGLLQIIRARGWPIRRGVYIHALLVSLANVLVLSYLAYWGIIGLRTWV